MEKNFEYRVKAFQRDDYIVVKVSLIGEDDDTVFIGSLADCHAYISLMNQNLLYL